MRTQQVNPAAQVNTAEELLIIVIAFFSSSQSGCRYAQLALCSGATAVGAKRQWQHITLDLAGRWSTASGQLGRRSPCVDLH
jgi:hypothetical protein